MRMSRHEKAIRDEIAELEKEIETIQTQSDGLEQRRQSKCAQRTMLLILLEKAEAGTGEPADD